MRVNIILGAFMVMLVVAIVFMYFGTVTKNIPLIVFGGIQIVTIFVLASCLAYPLKWFDFSMSAKEIKLTFDAVTSPKQSAPEHTFRSAGGGSGGGTEC